MLAHSCIQKSRCGSQETLVLVAHDVANTRGHGCLQLGVLKQLLLFIGDSWHHGISPLDGLIDSQSGSCRIRRHVGVKDTLGRWWQTMLEGLALTWLDELVDLMLQVGDCNALLVRPSVDIW